MNAFLKSVCCILLLGSAALAQTARERIAAEIARVEQESAKLDLTNPAAKDSKPTLDTLLGRAKAALEAGRLYVSLEELHRSRLTLAGAKIPKPGSVDLPKFEAEWKKVSVELRTPASPKPVAERSPAAVRAIAELASGQIPILIEASRAYATVTDANSGFYYIGQAQADAEEATFLSSLPLKSQKPYPYRSILPQLQELQSRIIAAFQPPRSIDKHPDFIRLNSTLKRAFELDSAKLYAGAMHQYLSAVQQLAVMESSPESGRAELKKKIEDLASEFAVSKTDFSIAELFIQRAQAALSAAEPTADNWKTAAAIAGPVIAAHQAAVLSKAKPQNQKKLITVTLVRWPYT